MRVIYLSAHLDDAILSCGGLIHDQVKSGSTVLVWTFMCGIPEGANSDNYIRRWEEDKKAVAMLGAGYNHFNLLDAFGRGYERVDEPVATGDKGFASVVKEHIRLALQEGDRIMCPLAVGGHIDHVVLRQACEMLDVPITYYVDFPYVEYHPEALISTVSNLSRYAATISPEGLSHWCEAVCAYESQVLYPSQEITKEKITEYWARINGIFLYERKTAERIFTDFFFLNRWNSSDSVSGPGSSLGETKVVRSELPRLIQQYNIKSISDVPCGDFLWMRTVNLGIPYCGGDIVPDLIRENQIRYFGSKRMFLVVNLIEDPLPVSDLLLCRDCLGHLSAKDVKKSIRNIRTSGFRYLLTTTFPEATPDWDIETGGWRPINLQASPYNFPEPLELINEKLAIEHYGPKCLGLWRIEDLPEET